MPRNISKYRLKKATSHLVYEIINFYETFGRLRQPGFSQDDINILLESFVIHTRNLFDFFYPKKNGIRPDDMVVYDYINDRKLFNVDKTKKRDLIFIVKKANRQLAHLTYTRNRYSLKTNKAWPYVDIARKMTKTIVAFYNALPDSYKNWSNIKLIKKIVGL